MTKQQTSDKMIFNTKASGDKGPSESSGVISYMKASVDIRT